MKKKQELETIDLIVEAKPASPPQFRENISRKLGIPIKGLTWGQKKALKADGIILEKMDATADNDDIVERVLQMAGMSLEKLCDLEVINTYELFGEVVRKTFLREEDAKNSG